MDKNRSGKIRYGSSWDKLDSHDMLIREIEESKILERMAKSQDISKRRESDILVKLSRNK